MRELLRGIKKLFNLKKLAGCSSGNEKGNMDLDSNHPNPNPSFFGRSFHLGQYRDWTQWHFTKPPDFVPSSYYHRLSSRHSYHSCRSDCLSSTLTVYLAASRQISCISSSLVSLGVSPAVRTMGSLFSSSAMPNPTPEDNVGEYMLDISWRCLTANLHPPIHDLQL